MPSNSTEPPSTKVPVRVGRRSRAILPGTTLAAFVVAVIAIVVTLGVSLQSLTARTAAIVSIGHINEIRQQRDLFLSDLTDAETSQRGFLITGLESFLEPYNRTRTSLPGNLATLRRLTVNPQQQPGLDTLEPLMTQKLDSLAQAIALKRAGQTDAEVEIVRSGTGIMDRLRAVIADMNAADDHLPDDLWTKISIEFYKDAPDAVFKALVE